MKPLTLNEAVEAFDEYTGYKYDRITHLASLSGLARLRGWTAIAEAMEANIKK